MHLIGSLIKRRWATRAWHP